MFLELQDATERPLTHGRLRLCEQVAQKHLVSFWIGVKLRLSKHSQPQIKDLTEAEGKKDAETEPAEAEGKKNQKPTHLNRMKLNRVKPNRRQRKFALKMKKAVALSRCGGRACCVSQLPTSKITRSTLGTMSRFSGQVRGYLTNSKSTFPAEIFAWQDLKPHGSELKVGPKVEEKTKELVKRLYNQLSQIQPK